MAVKPGPMDMFWERLGAESPASVARRAAVEYDTAEQAYLVPLCSLPLRILPDARRVEALPGDCSFEMMLASILYLLTARDEPPDGEWVSPRALPGGDFFFRGPHDMPTSKLEGAFGMRVEAFRKAAQGIGGRVVPAGDAAWEFQALPRVPIMVVLWAADDEFPARAQFLFDKSAHRQLPLDALLALCSVLVKRLTAGQL